MAKRVIIHKNVAGAVGTILPIDPSWTMKKFLKASGKKLGLKKATKIGFKNLK